MTDHAAFIAAIKAAPDDDAPRLIFADWLDERGESERAEFIRVQCELARHPVVVRDLVPLRRREQTLMGLNLTDWFSAACYGGYVFLNQPPHSTSPADAPFAVIRRGFIHSVTCTAADWLQHGDAILAEHPVREVRLTTGPELGHSFVEATTRADSNRHWINQRWPGVTFHLPKLTDGLIEFFPFASRTSAATVLSVSLIPIEVR